MRVSELFNVKRKSRRKLFVSVGILISGLLSVLVAIISVFGQYTGNYLISVSKDARKKGIAISRTLDFEAREHNLKFIPLNDTEDVLKEDIIPEFDDAIKTDGQSIPKNNNYIAFTFYLKNIGEETINVNYKIVVEDDYKKLGNATVFTIFEFEQVGDEFKLIHPDEPTGVDHRRDLESDSEVIASINILRFGVNEIRKFTFFVWIDGDESTPEMLGGAIKYYWVFGITSAGDAEEEVDKD